MRTIYESAIFYCPIKICYTVRETVINEQKWGEIMATLFEPFTIRQTTFKNRIVMAPMCMYASEEENGFVEAWHKLHYPTRAVGQVGLIILEATAVHPQGRISAKDLGIWDDAHIGGLREVVESIQHHGSKAGIQLAHAGRKATVEGIIYGPSDIPFSDDSRTPKELTIDEIEQIIIDFKEAARRAKEANFDVIELHAAHGYLLNAFLSPLSNKRTDNYGGSAENRYRILKEIIDAVRMEWTGPLFVRISANDYVEGGMTPEQYVEMVEWMRIQSVDLVDVSSGGVVLANIDAYPGYQVPFAETIKRETNAKTGTVGLITVAKHAEEILRNGRADFIFLGRELLRNPYWAYDAAKELRVEIEAPSSYKRGWTF